MKLDYIVKMVNNLSGFNIAEKTRKREVVFLRAIYFSIARTYFDTSLELIGREVGKDHATVLHGLKLWNNELNKIEMYVNFRNLVLMRLDLIDKETNTTRKNKQDFEKRLVELELKYIKLDNLITDYLNKFLLIPDDYKKNFIETRLEPYLKSINVQ